jgi:hypothetical protein
MEHDSEKARVEHMPDVELSKTTTDINNDWETDYSPEEQKRILWKIDRRLVITVGIMYCVSLMDRFVLAGSSCRLVIFARGATNSNWSMCHEHTDIPA